MRILVVHNPGAGKEEHECEALLAALEKEKHTAIYRSTEKKGLQKALKKKIDLVLAAGGDGTVGKIARRLVSTDIPLALLPLGTANNVARTLGFQVPARKLIARLRDGKRRAFDVGVARGPWGKRYFFEAVGAGLFSDYLQTAHKIGKKDEADSKAQKMKRHVTELRKRLLDCPARKWKITLDGEDFSGRYLLWQAMNIRSIGPVLTLAPEAETDDGRLDFVAAREEERSLLLEYLDLRLAGKQPDFPLPTKTFKRMRLRWKKFPLHFDDETWPEADDRQPDPCEIEIVVKPSALVMWNTK
jgi:diacylglycerol kinase family enzyme